ncbi:tyrosine-protein phosphatase [Planosporangium thailandense]|uniref:Tyrosine-protein phosphatase n=1 Tax=Planosporangium thailandense TaxID=765197 RepID=A0ABX0XX12_9ACTN|nr:tyrosine-protein phosphatase [Planosporangium thailandense]NJC70447.1 tyrosine-protein phosphatase [Planosporangium thailandense]
MLERGLGLIGAPNARDLGGIVTAGGARVRAGVLSRSTALGRLTDGDVATLAERKLAWVVDLRDRSEIDAAPADRLPADPAPRIRHIPVFDPEHPVFTYVSAVLMGHDVAVAAPAASVDGSPGAMVEIYRWMANDAQARAGFGAAVRTIGEAAGEPLLFHCSAGKDRTGWLTAILFEVLGVDRDTIVADYLATNDYSRATNVSIMNAMRAKGRVVHPEHLLPLLEVRPEYLAAAYAEVERGYGGMDRYVRDGLGVPDDILDALRDLLLDRP